MTFDHVARERERRSRESDERDLVLEFGHVERKIAEAEWVTQAWLAKVNRESLAGLEP
jgi:hypothetical protein